VQGALLVLSDVPEHLDRPLRPAAGHRAYLLAQLADDAAVLLEVQRTAEVRRKLQLLRRVLHGLLRPEHLGEGDGHPFGDRDQGVADLANDGDHPLTPWITGSTSVF